MEKKNLGTEFFQKADRVQARSVGVEVRILHRYREETTATELSESEPRYLASRAPTL